jgi:dimethylargininase
MFVAMIRDVSPSVEQCQLTHLSRQSIDVNLARMQHRQYEECLAGLGCKIHRLPPEPELPDAVFVEDAAVVLDELAIIARPGADSRRAETPSVARALSAFRRLHHIQSPGTLDGGDVLRLGKTVYIGMSSRSNQAGIDQVRALLAPHGYTVKTVEISGCLHLKSAVTPVGEKTVLIHRAWVDGDAFRDVALIDIDPSEQFGANALLVGGTVVYPSAHPATRIRLQEHGIAVRVVDLSELGKAEGGVTCCSLVFSVTHNVTPVSL